MREKPNRLPSPRSAARAVLLSGRPALLRTRMAVVMDVSATLVERQKASTPTGADSRSCAPPTLHALRPQASRGRAVKAVGGAHSCDAVRTCTHQERDLRKPQGTGAPKAHVLRPHYRSNRACYCEKHVSTGRACPKWQHEHIPLCMSGNSS